MKLINLINEEKKKQKIKMKREKKIKESESREGSLLASKALTKWQLSPTIHYIFNYIFTSI